MIDVKYIWQWFLAALFPPKCPLCYQRGISLHLSCIRPHVDLCFDEDKKLIWISEYNNPFVKKLIERYKFFGFTDLIKPWIQVVEPTRLPNGFIDEVWSIVPIPLHWTRKIWRGFNQAEVIADGLVSIWFKHSRVSHGLVRTKKTKQQARLSKGDRQKNIQNAFKWREFRTPPERVILVDDVYTSGSTLQEAKNYLLRQGAKDVWCFVLARKF